MHSVFVSVVAQQQLLSQSSIWMALPFWDNSCYLPTYILIDLHLASFLSPIMWFSTTLMPSSQFLNPSPLVLLAFPARFVALLCFWEVIDDHLTLVSNSKILDPQPAFIMHVKPFMLTDIVQEIKFYLPTPPLPFSMLFFYFGKVLSNRDQLLQTWCKFLLNQKVRWQMILM